MLKTYNSRHFTKCLPKNTAKHGQQIYIMTKYCMFSSTVCQTPENFTQRMIAMVMTFCMSKKNLKNLKMSKNLKNLKKIKKIKKIHKKSKEPKNQNIFF